MPTQNAESESRVTLDKLGAYTDTWLEYRNRWNRTMGFDGNVNHAYEVVNKHMNNLLEKYFSLLVESETNKLDISLPPDVRQEEEQAWQEYEGA